MATLRHRSTASKITICLFCHVLIDFKDATFPFLHEQFGQAETIYFDKQHTQKNNCNHK